MKRESLKRNEPRDLASIEPGNFGKPSEGTKITDEDVRKIWPNRFTLLKLKIFKKRGRKK